MQPIFSHLHHGGKLQTMKRKKLLSLALLVLFCLSSCKDKVFKKYIANVPIYMSYEAFRSSAKFEAPRAIRNHGNIYKKDNYLLIVEEDEGIHIINNTNPSSPQNAGFLKVLGCSGMAIKDNYLFVNSYIDLVVFDISSWGNPKEVARIKDLFHYKLPAHNPQYGIAEIDPNQGIVVGWKIEKIKEETLYNGNQVVLFNGNFVSESANSVGGIGISGSITKFSIINDHLYVMDGNDLHPIQISNPIAPAKKEPVKIWRTVETLFAQNNNLFMGTTTGMLIYSVSNPDMPTPISEVNHMTACDPVVVQDNIAYVTVRSGRACGGTINQLDVIDISDLSAPYIIKSYEMYNPHGLGIDGDLLFICDGAAGLKVFKASNPSTIDQNLIQQFLNIQATDIIPHNKTAIMIGSDGLYQYDYSNPAQITLLSKINF
jgi:hypothetical protein